MAKSSQGMSYTRKKYARGSPPSGVVKFTMGEPSEDYQYKVELVALEKAVIKGSALESARMASNRVMNTKYDGSGYFLRIRVYPHEIIRSHKFMSFAGADRLSQGMRHAFGKPIARAARVDNGQVVVSISTDEDKLDDAKIALKRAGAKLPLKYRIEIHESSN